MGAFTAFTLKQIPPPEGVVGEDVLIGFWGGVRVVVRPDPDQEQGEKHRRWIMTLCSREAAANKQRKRARHRDRTQDSED
jgi:hypothetical protein